MKHIYMLINTAFLFLMVGGVNAGVMEHNEYPEQPLLADSGKVRKADKEFIKIIEKEIRNPLTPFPGEFGGNMKLTFIQRDKMNISLHLTSGETFDQSINSLTDPLSAANIMSEGYFYFLPFMYDNERGVCRREKFYPTQAVIKISYSFPNIGYRTQLVKPVSEICGWTNRDKTPSQDTSFTVTAQRNLFSSYMDALSQALGVTWGKEYPNKALSMRLDNDTLTFTLEDSRAIKPISEKALTDLFFPDSMCKFFQPFPLLNIKLRFETIIGEEKDIRVIEKDAKQLCVPHT